MTTVRYFRLGDTGQVALARFTTGAAGATAERLNATTGGEWVETPSLWHVLFGDNTDAVEIGEAEALSLATEL